MKGKHRFFFVSFLSLLSRGRERCWNSARSLLLHFNARELTIISFFYSERWQGPWRRRYRPPKVARTTQQSFKSSPKTLTSLSWRGSKPRGTARERKERRSHLAIEVRRSFVLFPSVFAMDRELTIRCFPRPRTMENKGWRRGKLAAMALCWALAVSLFALSHRFPLSLSSAEHRQRRFSSFLGFRARHWLVKRRFRRMDDALARARGSQRRRSISVPPL